MNRHYSSGQGRFTQVDPLGAVASSLGNPQSNNLFAYVQNMPVDFVDPTGLNMAGPGTRYGMLDPMGVAYYVDGMLSDARTAWSMIEAGAGYIAFENVAGVDVHDYWISLGESGAVRGQHIFLSGDWSEPNDGECIDFEAQGQIRPPPRPARRSQGNVRRGTAGRTGSRGRRPSPPRGGPPSMGRPNLESVYGDHLNPRWGPAEQAQVTWRSFDGFKRVFGNASPGNEWHHVVEQSQTQFGGARLNSPGNLIQIPWNIHRKISGFYSSKREFSGNQRVRDWLRNQTFEQQHAFGMQVLRDFGALPCRAP